MNRRYFREVKNRKRSGIAGLAILLLGIGMLAIIYVMYMGAHNPFLAFQGGLKDRYSDPNASPWEEGHLFLFKALDGYDMSGRRPPFSSQPQLTGLLEYSAAVYDGDKKNGQIELMINDDGDVRASCSGDFQIDGKHYHAVAPRYPSKKEKNMFWGNIAPLKIYEDENGKDNSKLYVITQGLFHLKGLIEENSFEGFAYITCWIDTDYTAEGTLAIPLFGDKETVIFSWGPVGLKEK